ncbi:MAG: molybdate ABC transporter substrate-binding protein [Planctomycetaceae bacterium]
MSRIVLLALAALAACGRTGEVTLFAAASLGEALPDLRAAAPVAFKTSLEATSTLARQVERGAPADLLLSADSLWKDYLASRGLVREARPLLRNVLALLVREGGEIPRDREALRRGAFPRIAVAEETVPAGRYARAALAGLGLEERFFPCRSAPAAVWALQSGAADACVAYATDARAPGVVVAFLFDAPSDPAVVYWALLLRDGREARRLYAWLSSAESMALFRLHGFLPLD